MKKALIASLPLFAAFSFGMALMSCMHLYSSSHGEYSVASNVSLFSPKQYRVNEVLRVVDGDTFDLSLDLGFGIELDGRCRLLGVDCPEVKGPSRELGKKATLFSAEWLASRQMLASVEGKDSFGRWLVVVIDEPSGAKLSDALIESGNAVLYER